MAGSGTAQLRDHSEALLRVEHLEVEFPASRGEIVHAVSDVSFDVLRGETLGIVGESGCGKSTTARAVLSLLPLAAGSVRFEGTEVAELSGKELRRIRPRLQMICQDPKSSLNPRRRVRDVVGEGLAIWGTPPGRTRDDLVDEVLDAVGLDATVVGNRRPNEFSGGQCQRIAIARALVLDPHLLICDEPVSALDVSVQAQILGVLRRMKERYALTLVFIAHDLAVVKQVSDRVAVMYLGKICEVGSVDAVYSSPAHPYTQALLDSVPVPDPRARSTRPALTGDVPSPLHPPSGCRFRTRCPRAQEICALEEPVTSPAGHDQFVACHFPSLNGDGRRPDPAVVAIDGSRS